jgi:predicted GH43/DUF377 family glycosyl hydrolase
MYVGFDGEGYQTGLAVRDDLINWSKKGVILKREDNVGWDSVGAAGTWIVKNTNNLYELPTLKKIDNRYWMLYHSYPEKGYETGAAKMGLAWTEDEELLDWHRLPEPVYTWEEGKPWERGDLYKGCLIEEKGIYYLSYNAKNETFSYWKEQTGVAMSSDMFNWKRYEVIPLLRVSDESWNSKFCSDPYVVKDNDLSLMFFFGYNGVHALGGIAISKDLLHWEKYPMPILSNGSKGEIDEVHAHKPSMIYYNDTLYHFYCACRTHKDEDPAKNLGDGFRCITVATSRPMPY